jgi:WD40 repeat protein
MEVAVSTDAAASRFASEGPSLVITSAENLGQRIQVSSAGIVLGREGELEPLFCGDPLVSRRHARVYLADDRSVQVADLDSTNGTFVNGKAIRLTTRLADQDVLRIGSTGMRLDCSGLPADHPAAAGARQPDGGQLPQAEPPSEADRLDAFISYARRPHDREFVDWLSGELKRHGKQIWLDRSNIEPAADWRARITKGIEQANAFIFVISPDSASSRECVNELEIAVADHKRIVPVVFRPVPENSLPAALTAPNWISFGDAADRARHVEKLIEALESDLEWRDLSTRLVVRAREWLDSGKDSSFLLRGSDLRAAERWYEEKEGHKEQPTDKQYQYLAASRKGTARRQRALLSGVSLALVVAIVLSVVALLQRDAAVTNQHIAQSGQHAAESAATLNSDPEMSALLAIRGLNVHYTLRAEDALRQAVTRLQLLRTFRAGSPTAAVAISADGSEVVAGTETGAVPRWAAAAGRPLPLIQEPRAGGLGSSNFSIIGNSITSVSFSPDGTKILTSSDDTNARIWNAATGKPLKVLVASNTLNDAAFSPSGAEVVTASEDGKAVIWDAASGSPVLTLREPGGAPMLSAAFSPDGAEVVTASSDGTARIWSTISDAQLAVLNEPGGAAINDAAFSPDDAEMVTASLDGTARIWSTATGTQLMLLGAPSGSDLKSAAFSPDGAEIVTAGSGRTATIWNASDGEQLTALEEPGGGRINRAIFGPSGTEVETASSDGMVRVWDAFPRQLVKVVAEPGGAPLNDASVNHADTELVTAASDGTARVWDIATGRQLSVLREGSQGSNFAADGNAINSASFSPNGAEVLTASNDGTARIWEAATGKLLTTFDTGFPTYSAAFGPGGTYVMTATDAAEITIWNAQSGKQVADFFAGKAFLFHASYSPNGTEVATASNDGTARIWNALTGRQLAIFREPHAAPIGSAAFSPNGTEIVTVSDDGTARVWDIRTGRQLTVIAEPQGARFYTAAFNPDGTRIVTSSGAGTATVWDAFTGKQLTTLEYAQGASILSAAFNSSGSEVVTAGYDGLASVWSATPAGSLPTVVQMAMSRVESGLAPNELKADLAAIPG